MNSISADYHRAFKDGDIRGIYPTEIDEEVVYLVARAFIDEFEYKKIVVGRDMRLSTPALHEAFVRGAIDAGAQVVDVGMVHSPLLYFASGSLKLPGAMITASHSPKEYNGLKLVHAGAVPLTGAHGLRAICKRIDRGEFKEPKKQGALTIKDVREAYQRFVLKGFALNQYAGMKVAVDVGNGMATVLMPLLRERMPDIFTTLFETFDGRFPHRGSDPTLIKNQKPLRQEMKQHSYDFGVAFDGDADRVAFLDEKGRYINGALIGALVAQRLLKKRPKAKIAYTSLTSRAYEEEIRAAGGTPVLARVGHAFIKEAMRQKDILFGAEHSGHFYYQDYFCTDSVTLTLCYVLDAYAEAKAAGQTFSEMMRPFLQYHQTEDVIVEVKNPPLAMKKTGLFLRSLKPKKIKPFDGMIVDFGEVWGSVKISVTEYALKMMFESKSKQAAEAMRDKVVAYVQSIADD